MWCIAVFFFVFFTSASSFGLKPSLSAQCLTEEAQDNIRYGQAGLYNNTFWPGICVLLIDSDYDNEGFPFVDNCGSIDETGVPDCCVEQFGLREDGEPPYFGTIFSYLMKGWDLVCFMIPTAIGNDDYYSAILMKGPYKVHKNIAKQVITSEFNPADIVGRNYDDDSKGSYQTELYQKKRGIKAPLNERGVSFLYVSGTMDGDHIEVRWCGTSDFSFDCVGQFGNDNDESTPYALFIATQMACGWALYACHAADDSYNFWTLFIKPGYAKVCNPLDYRSDYVASGQQYIGNQASKGYGRVYQ